MTQQDKKPRVAIVTGGMTGIGLATAAALAQAGCRLAVGARRGDDGALQEQARAAMGAEAMFGVLDVRSSDSVAAFVERIAQELGPPDILVNNAGVSVHHTVEGHAEEDWLRVIDVNLNGVFRMMRACLPGMKTRGWGRIVSIASTAAHAARPSHAAYCASKAGLLGLTRAVALEGAPHGVTAVTVSPTWVETDMLRESARKMAARSGRSYEDEIAALAEANPQRRLVQPEELGAVVAFCCSDAAPALTMEDILVNAGAHW